MINLFKLAENDLSLTYLYQIFGSMNGLLHDPTWLPHQLNKFEVEGSNITMIGSMFKTFNTTILAIGALIVVYVAVVGVMKTAHEGEFMGKNWSNLWLPIRTVLGVATLVPTASGYSAIQLVFMWIIIQGVAAADTLWSTTLTARAILGTPYSDAKVPDIGSEEKIKSLFQGLVCAATANRSDANPTGGDKGNYFCNGKKCGDDIYQIVEGGTTNDNTINLGPSGVSPSATCGTVTYCNPDPEKACKNANSMQCLACQAQDKALKDMLPKLAVIATSLASADYTYRNFYATSYNTPDNADWGPIYDYCANQTPPVPKESCCVANNAFPGMSCPQGSGTDLPSVDDKMGGAPQPGSASSDAVSKIYYPYLMDSNTDYTLQTAINDYSSALQAALGTYIDQSKDNPDNLQAATIGLPGLGLPAGPIFEVGQKLGWIFGGVYYYVIASEGAGSALQDSVPDFKVNIDTGNEMTTFRTNIEAASYYLDAINAPPPSTDTGTNGGPTNFVSSGNLQLSFPGAKGSGKGSFLTKKIMGPLTDAIMGVLKMITHQLNYLITAAGGPINMLQIFGVTMVVLSEIAYAYFLYLSIGVGLLAGLASTIVLGVGMPEILNTAVIMAYSLIAPVFLLFIGWLMVTGAMLAVFLPLVPFTIYFFGVIGWFTAVIEAMIAAPLVAIGILSPSGQHEIMGKSEAAIGMMLAIFLRPSLMIFGMVGAMLLVVVVLSFLIQSFGFVIVFITKGLIEPLTLIMFISAFVFLVFSSLTKCFALIHLIPHQVMAWIGIHHTPGDKGEAPIADLQSKMSGVADKGAAAGKAIGEQGKAMGEQAGKKVGEGVNKAVEAGTAAATGGASTIAGAAGKMGKS